MAGPDTKTSKKACVTENEYIYIYIYIYIYFLYVSLCFGNSHSCFQIKSSDYHDGASAKLKSSDYHDGVSAKLKYLNSYDYIFNPVRFSRTVILDLQKTCLFHPKTNPKEIGADISISLGCSVLY